MPGDESLQSTGSSKPSYWDDISPGETKLMITLRFMAPCEKLMMERGEIYLRYILIMPQNKISVIARFCSATQNKSPHCQCCVIDRLKQRGVRYVDTADVLSNNLVIDEEKSFETPGNAFQKLCN